MFKRTLENSLGISQRLDRQRRHWNKVVKDKKAFIPWEHKGISEEEAEKENLAFGEFASGYMSEELKIYCQKKDKINPPMILSVGWGKGYDYGWLREAISSGFKTSIVDISDVACSWAEAFAESQWKIESDQYDYSTNPPLEPEVIRAEIRSALKDPETFLGLELRTVAIWYMSRIIGCLPSEKSATKVLQKMGESLREKKEDESLNRIVLISALRDDNPDRVGKTSKLYSRNSILQHISEGSGSPSVHCREKVYRYFGQIYTAMTITTK